MEQTATALAWPALTGLLGVAGTALAFFWKEYRDAKAVNETRREKAIASQRAARLEDEERHERALAAKRAAALEEAKQIRIDFETMRADYNAEFLRLRSRIAELERESQHDRALLAATQRVNEDLTAELVRLRAEVSVLRSEVGTKADIVKGAGAQ